MLNLQHSLPMAASWLTLQNPRRFSACKDYVNNSCRPRITSIQCIINLLILFPLQNLSILNKQTTCNYKKYIEKIQTNLNEHLFLHQ